jgi:hypothetical protein
MIIYRPGDRPISPSAAASSRAVSPNADSLPPGSSDAETEHTVATQRRADLILALLEACSEASEEDWDSYGGHGVLLGSYLLTERLLRSFPERLPLPEISVHPDGELALDWIGGQRQVFTISVGEDGTLSYAGLFGAAKVNGKEWFAGTFPPSLMAYVRRVSETDGRGERA